MARQLYERISPKPAADDVGTTESIGSLADLDESAFLQQMKKGLDDDDFASIFENTRVLGLDYRREQAERRAASSAAVAKPKDPPEGST